MHWRRPWIPVLGSSSRARDLNVNISSSFVRRRGSQTTIVQPFRYLSIRRSNASVFRRPMSDYNNRSAIAKHEALPLGWARTTSLRDLHKVRVFSSCALKELGGHFLGLHAIAWSRPGGFWWQMRLIVLHGSHGIARWSTSADGGEFGFAQQGYNRSLARSANSDRSPFSSVMCA